MVLIRYRDRRYNFSKNKLNRYVYTRVCVSPDVFKYQNFFLGCETFIKTI